MLSTFANINLKIINKLIKLLSNITKKQVSQGLLHYLMLNKSGVLLTQTTSPNRLLYSSQFFFSLLFVSISN